MNYALDEALNLSLVSDGLFSFGPDELYWNFNNAFGGWVAASTIKAVSLMPGFRGELISQNVQFISGVRAEKLYAIVKLREQKRQTDFWSVEISDTADGKRALATAEIITGARGQSRLDYSRSIPKTKAPEDCVRILRNQMTPRWFDKYEVLLSEGRPFKENPTPRTVALIRDIDKRPLDVISISALVDTPMPRPFFLGEKSVRTFSTLSMSTYIYATEAEIAQVGSDYVVLESDSSAVRHALSNEDVRLYRRDGLLLASSAQTAVFR